MVLEEDISAAREEVMKLGRKLKDEMCKGVGGYYLVDTYAKISDNYIDALKKYNKLKKEKKINDLLKEQQDIIKQLQNIGKVKVTPTSRSLSPSSRINKMNKLNNRYDEIVRELEGIPEYKGSKRYKKKTKKRKRTKKKKTKKRSKSRSRR